MAPARKNGAARRRRRSEPWWVELGDEELLELRLSELGIEIDGTALQSRVDQLYDELERAGLRFRPHVWLSTDWFTPDDSTGFAIPFFLAHPRLARLERRQMLEVEGGSHDWCMKLLRHETGHAIDNAYRLHRRKGWRETFGRFSEPYRDTYAARPGSRRFVQHLDSWYAQSHPCEDYAETFAVWLNPGSRWRRKYEGWPAMEKLEYLDSVMREIARRPPETTSRKRPDSLSRLRLRLREHYRRKQAEYEGRPGSAYDWYLRRVFSEEPTYRHRPRASSFLRRARQDLRRRVSTLTGKHSYVVDQALNEIIVRCRELGLRLARGERESYIDAAVVLTAITQHMVRSGERRYRR